MVGNYAGSISNVRFYHRALSLEELGLLSDLETSHKQLTYYDPNRPLDALRRISSYTFAENGFDTSLHGRTAALLPVLLRDGPFRTEGYGGRAHQNPGHAGLSRAPRASPLPPMPR